MQVCGCNMQLGEGRVSGICLCVAFTAMHLSEVLLFSHPMPVGRVLVLWFMVC